MFELAEEDFREAIELLKALLRIDTTNPPGNERPAAEFVASILDGEGIAGEIVEAAPGRASLVARLEGSGEERPLLLNSHLDVVPADENDGWRHPPFSGTEADDCIWGRGAIDMKGFTAIGLTVMRLLKRRGVELKRDIILAAVADEEAGCAEGSAWLVANRPELVDAEYVLNEVGGFTLEIEGRRFYPVQTAEKGCAWLRVKVKGRPGHGSLPAPESCLEKLGAALVKLTAARLPLHPTEPALAFLRTVASRAGFPASLVLPLLAKPGIGGLILDRLVSDPDQRATLQAILCNTANPTMVRAGTKINVVPGEAIFEIDGRLLPGQRASDLVREVEAIVGPGFTIEVVVEAEATVFPAQTPLFDAIRAVIEERDPEGIVVPYLMPGFTDSRSYASTGAICYGFYPLKLPPGMVFSKLFHGVDERMPLASFRFGVETLFDLVVKFADQRT